MNIGNEIGIFSFSRFQLDRSPSGSRDEEIATRWNGDPRLKFNEHIATIIGDCPDGSNILNGLCARRGLGMMGEGKSE